MEGTVYSKTLIIESVSSAVLETEKVFGGRRHISKNDNVAEAWRKAGVSIVKYLPNEHLGIWLQNKGEAWANPNKWGPEILEENNLQIEQIKNRIARLVGNRSKIFRPKNI